MATVKTMTGLDLETWRLENQLNTQQLQEVTGLGAESCKATLRQPWQIAPELELLVRLYIANPAGTWPGKSIRIDQLFDQLYEQVLSQYKERDLARHAHAERDCYKHFGKLLNRAPLIVRKWVAEGPTVHKKTHMALTIQLILAKLSQSNDPSATLVRTSSAVYAARGERIAKSHPLPKKPAPGVLIHKI